MSCMTPGMMDSGQGTARTRGTLWDNPQGGLFAAACQERVYSSKPSIAVQMSISVVNQDNSIQEVKGISVL